MVSLRQEQRSSELLLTSILRKQKYSLKSTRLYIMIHYELYLLNEILLTDSERE